MISRGDRRGRKEKLPVPVPATRAVRELESHEIRRNKRRPLLSPFVSADFVTLLTPAAGRRRRNSRRQLLTNLYLSLAPSALSARDSS